MKKNPHLKRIYSKIFLLVFLSPEWLLAEERSGDPLEKLPSHIKQVTHFGERAAWSPDSTRIAFIHKTLGDAFELELDTETIRCLTCHFPHSGFFRVQYLPSGDFILIGPNQVQDPAKARWDDSEIWKPRVSVGVGVRLVIPFLGQRPIAIDFGIPILKESEDETLLISFNFGSNF